MLNNIKYDKFHNWYIDLEQYKFNIMEKEEATRLVDCSVKVLSTYKHAGDFLSNIDVTDRSIST